MLFCLHRTKVMVFLKPDETKKYHNKHPSFLNRESVMVHFHRSGTLRTQHASSEAAVRPAQSQLAFPPLQYPHGRAGFEPDGDSHGG